jgi:Tfp pilus assembly protein PilN
MRPVNLLPAKERPRRATGTSGAAYALIGALAALLVLVVVYVLSANQVNARKTEAAEAAREAQEAEAQRARLGAFGDFARVKETRLASVKQLADGRFDWERFLREVALVLPKGAWLTSVDASALGEPSGSSGTSTPGTTTSAAQSSGQGSGNPAAKLEGCARRQPHVASLMVRLRRMYRVLDVRLNESARGETAASSGATSGSPAGCGRTYKFLVTVEFSPARPPADTGEKVPARLGGGA